MFKIYSIILLGVIFWLFVTCSSNSVSGNAGGNTWLISQDLVMDGGPGKDGIPAIGNPVFIPVHQVSFLKKTDLVLIVKLDGKVRIYPHPILDWHEIVNDGVNDHKFSVTYCPLTGSGLVFNRLINGNETTFGVSGLLYNSNLIPYDRATDSNWSQMLFKCVNGPLMGKEAELFPVIETTWATASNAYPEAEVLSTNTGYQRDYTFYPYGSYKTNDQLLFPVKPLDERLPKKERVLGLILNTITMVIPINHFSDSIEIINRDFGGKISIVGSKAYNFAYAFNRKTPGGLLNLTPVQNALPIIMKDQHGNYYDMFGEVVSGPDIGMELEPVKGYIAYWFAWAAIWPHPNILREN